MAESRTVGTTPGVTKSVGAYTVYFAGGCSHITSWPQI